MTAPQVFAIKDLESLKKLVQKFAQTLVERQILLLEGPMGAGKTQFVRFLLEALQTDFSGMTSPTFAIHNRYETRSGGIDHLDLYRLENSDDLESTGFWDLFSVPKGLVIIEWADKIDQKLLPPSWAKTRISIEFDSDENGADGDEGFRQIQISQL